MKLVEAKMKGQEEVVELRVPEIKPTKKPHGGSTGQHQDTREALTLFDDRPIRPMLAKTGEAFDDENYFFEPKWDGLRAILFYYAGRIELQNRNLRDATPSYPELQKITGHIRAKTAIMDGEVVVLREDGIPDFGRLQARFGVDDAKRVGVLAKTMPVTYVAFDLLHVNSRDIITLPLVERKSSSTR